MLKHQKNQWLCIVCFAFASAGCDTFRTMREFFHPDNTKQQEPAEVQVEVEPGDGIRIFLDGRQIARFSPHTINNVSPGEHTLEIRAKGYHSFVLPFKAYSGQTINIPVQLRKNDGTKQSAGRPGADRIQKGTVVRLIVEPKVPIILNGSPQNTATVVLQEAEGHLTAGSILLHYKRDSAGLYEFVLPGDDATWARNGKVIDAASRFILGGKEIQLYRVGMDDRKQLLIMLAGQQ